MSKHFMERQNKIFIYLRVHIFYSCQQVQREQLKKRRLDSLNKLFLKWDNEGSGHLLTDDVVKVLNGYRDGNFADQIQKCMKDYPSFPNSVFIL